MPVLRKQGAGCSAVPKLPVPANREMKNLITLETRESRLRRREAKAEVKPKENSKIKKQNEKGAKQKSSQTKVEAVKGSMPPLSSKAKFGSLVWCRFGRRMWPAMVIQGSVVGRPPAKVSQEWLFWFGEETISQMDFTTMSPFIATFNDHFDAKYLKSSKSYEKSTQAVLSECSRRAGLEQMTVDDLKEWGKTGKSLRVELDGPLDGAENLSDDISSRLEKLKKWVEDEDSTDESEEEGSDEEEEVDEDARPLRSETYENEKATWNQVWRGVISVTDVCISCGTKDQVSHCHPFFVGGHCNRCRKEFDDSLFLYGSDNISMYCSICSNAGSMFICCQVSCHRVFCQGCIRTLAGDDELKRVSSKKNWLCYLCLPSQSAARSLIETQEDWHQQMMKCFFKEAAISEMPSNWDVKKPIRVLSLFDGIGTGKYVLDLLGFQVEEYFACEINADCIRLTEVRHPLIKQLGDVTALTISQLQQIAPIDLLIGGSPCQDFSIVNPNRQGLLGDAGILFFDFYRILSNLQWIQRGRPLFWLYENVSSMNKETKSIMTRFLGRQPNTWDAINFTAQRRKRLFWGNVPGLSGGECIDNDEMTALKDVLMPGRKARMEKVRCVTTNANSLHQNQQKEYPVEMGDHMDTLWIPELERLFGFPEHYTDVANISITKRQCLLGNSWSVPVVKRLLFPLKNYFASHRQPRFDF